MAKIPAVIFILVGAGVAGFSYFMDYMQGKNSFTLFLIIGSLLFLYGIGKLIFRKKENVEKHEHHLHHGKQQVQNPQQIKPTDKRYVFCPYCGSIIQPNFTFCYNCGSRLKN